MDQVSVFRLRRYSATLTLALYAIAYLAFSVRFLSYCRGASLGAEDPDAMTVGCSEANCCTSRCYLDEQGVHHCVPKDGRSCECGLTSNGAASSLAPELEIATIPHHNSMLPEPLIAGQIVLSHILFETRDITISTPPPRDQSGLS